MRAARLLLPGLLISPGSTLAQTPGADLPEVVRDAQTPNRELVIAPLGYAGWEPIPPVERSSLCGTTKGVARRLEIAIPTVVRARAAVAPPRTSLAPTSHRRTGGSATDE